MDISKHFSELSEEQLNLLVALCKEVKEVNEVINLISRKDIEQLEERHMLPSMGIGRVCKFAPGSRVMDVGTGGGFPGLPLAIMNPKVEFLLVDSIGKKIKAVEGIAEKLGLKNVTCMQVRVEDLEDRFDFVIGRAVTALPRFLEWVGKNVRKGKKSSLENGILYLKGGDFSEELKELRRQPDEVFDIGDLSEGKCVVYFKYPIGRSR